MVIQNFFYSYPQMSHSFSYDLNNRLTGQYDMYGKYVTYQYDGLNRRIQMSAPDGRVFTYSYNTGNRLSQIVAASRTYEFTHDLAGQRTGLTHPNGATTTYTCTPAGYLSNILARNSQQVTINSFAYTHDALGRRASLTDLAGLHTYQYDDTYQLTQATHPTPPTEQFSYDPVGNRLGTTVDLNNALLEDSEFTYTYDYNDFDSFGKITSQTGTLDQPFAFTGREYDAETGLYYYRARYYDPRAGRFISKDPIGFMGGDVNLFRYVGNDPANFTDPSGLFAIPWPIIIPPIEKIVAPIIGGIIGGIIGNELTKDKCDDGKWTCIMRGNVTPIGNSGVQAIQEVGRQKIIRWHDFIAT